MSAATFTPGPWKYGPLDEENTAKRRVLSASGLLVAEARGATGPASVRDANARLIAAAPELLEALRDVLPFAISLVGDYKPGATDEDFDKINRAVAVIAKAEGSAD